MDLFNHTSEAGQSPNVPLAERLRPKDVSEILGQDASLGEDSFLASRIRSGNIPSLIIWGPPGSGKTTFAKALSSKVKATFVNVHAVNTGAKEMREMGESGRNRRLMYSERTVLFIDEIHRLNKAQQDVLLPYVEAGDIFLIGATTENPSYEVNAALLSRCHLVRFKRLSESALKQLLLRACADFEANCDAVFSKTAQDLLISNSDGDGRRLLNLAEVALTHFKETNGQVDDVLLKKLFEQSPISFDKKGSAHYDTISAFIKSIRGSDPDAAIYYLARMLVGGENPIFIARRLVILASEDIGNADPRGLSVAIAAAQAVELVGLPEGAINLAQAVTYLASCPKSNRSYLALRSAEDFVRKTGSLEIPTYLRSSKYGLTPNESAYEYPHDLEIPYSVQPYLPKAAQSKKFYDPSSIGFEKQIQQYLSWMRQSIKKNDD